MGAVAGSGVAVVGIDTPALGDRSYLAHDGEVALVVDPRRDIDRVYKCTARRFNWKFTADDLTALLHRISQRKQAASAASAPRPARAAPAWSTPATSLRQPPR